eukprot:snap_masked-scaffold22_size673200-processed-gene-4.16 protein:Tk12691 transcript:snap_masked-scaffold22_size673200-processed-gene-4.16-mRNA-1 annotation:"multidrug abc transporter atp-binding protein"
MGMQGSKYSEIALFATVAGVCAEADHQYLYNGAYGYGIPQAYGVPLTYANDKSAPCVNAANLPVPCNTAGLWLHLPSLQSALLRLVKTPKGEDHGQQDQTVKHTQDHYAHVHLKEIDVKDLRAGQGQHHHSDGIGEVNPG